MSTQRKGPLWDTFRLALEGAPTEEFLAKAKKAKADIVNRAYELWNDVTLLDQLVNRIAPEVEWKTGWAWELRSTTKSTPPEQHETPRSQRILEIAEELVADGAKKVKSKTIVKLLIEEGYKGKERDLAVSVGNILARSDGWIKVSPGIYKPKGGAITK